MKVLVTGCNGFIGKNICKLLKKNNFIVVGVGQEDNSCVNVDAYVKADISENNFPDNVIDVAKDSDVFVHTAAVISNDNFNRALIEVNCLGALNLLKLSAEVKCKKIVNISSAPIIGIPVVHPIDESHSVFPRSLYHITKVMQEHIFNLSDMYGITSINVRVPSPIGVGMNPKTILPVFIKRCIDNEKIIILGKGGRRQNYIDVRDIAEFVKKCIESDTANGCYNIGSDTTISNIELAEKCKLLSESSSEITFSGTDDPDENVNWDFSTVKARTELNFVPRYTIDDTINMLINEMRR